MVGESPRLHVPFKNVQALGACSSIRLRSRVYPWSAQRCRLKFLPSLIKMPSMMEEKWQA